LALRTILNDLHLRCRQIEQRRDQRTIAGGDARITDTAQQQPTEERHGHRATALHDADKRVGLRPRPHGAAQQGDLSLERIRLEMTVREEAEVERSPMAEAQRDRRSTVEHEAARHGAELTEDSPLRLGEHVEAGLEGAWDAHEAIVAGPGG